MEFSRQEYWSCHFGEQYWVAIPFSKESSWLGDWTKVSCITGRFFTIWATREATIYQLYLNKTGENWSEIYTFGKLVFTTMSCDSFPVLKDFADGTTSDNQ